jgi:hypothetical protein
MANNTEQKIIQDTIKSFFNDFNKQTINITLESNNALLEKISAYFVDRLNPNSENSFNKKTAVDELTSDIKKTTYYNIKNIYDKICGVNDEQSTGDYLIQKIEDLNKINVETLNKQRLFYNLKFSSEECFGEGENQNIVDYDLYQIFQIVDRGNNDIGTKVLADLGYLYDNLYAEFDSQPIAGQPDKNITVNNLTKGSFQKLFSGLATQSGFLFQQIPNYLNLNSAISGDNEESINNVVDDLFGVHQTTNLAGAEIFENKNNTKFGGLFGLPGYIFQLGTTTSSTDNQEKVQVNDYTNSFCLDIGLDNNNEINIIGEDIPHEIKNSNITCFAVDFATQKQQMFNNIQLDTNEFYDTEESIRTWVDAVNSTDQYLQTTNLFPVLEKRSYTCTVSGLGNATIQPLSYFYLRNVPLFHGTYWITNVNHKINQNTMSTTFKGVRQPIISKQDVRKQLLELMRKKADALLKASDTANRVITEGISDTEGDIKQIDNSDKQYGAIVQQRLNDNGYQEFDAKTLIGSFIFSITGSNDDKDPNNLGVIATLYNQAKAHIDSEEHAKIIKNIKNIVVGKIKIGARDGDKRYCQNKDEPSLSVLYKNSGYSNIGKLSTLLDDIISESEYNRLIKLDKNIQYYGLTTNPVVSQDTNTTLQLQLGNPITTVKSENILINQTTLYFDHDSNSIIKNNTRWAGSEFDGNFLNTYDIISTFSGNTINTAVTVKGISIKYLGTFSSESGKRVSFYSVNNGKINWGVNTKKDYDIIFATDDDLNQLSGDPNKDIKISIIPITQTQKIQNIKTISQYLKSIGITREGAIGLIGNILGESGADPKAAEKNREIGGLGGIGIVQWTASRRRNLEKAANNNNDKILDLNFQLEYLGKELQESYSKVFNNLKTSKSIEDSTIFVLENFEIPKTFLERKSNPQAYEATKLKRITFAKSAEPIVNEVYGGNSITQTTNTTTTNTVSTSKSITIGDSISVGVNGVYRSISLINNPILSTVGWTINNLVETLKKPNVAVNKSVKNVVLSIGSNNNWTLQITKQNELIALIKSKYPDAKLYILNGSYGWGNLKVDITNTDSVWENKITTYIKVYKDNGFTVVGNITKLNNHPAKDDNLFKSFNGILSKL